MKLNIFEKAFGSVLFSGYAPFASGTVSSFVAVLIYLIPGFSNPTFMIAVISVFAILGWHTATKFENVYGKDPSQCTIDEFVGTWISLLFVPQKVLFIIIAFFIWRLLDIFKPFPAKQLEKLSGGAGIMLDDIVSALYSLIFIHIIIRLIYFLKFI